MGDTNYTYSSIADGRKATTTAGTAVALLSSATPCRLVRVKAFTDNSDMVAVGASTVLAAAGSARGLMLAPGEEVEIRIDDVSKLYVDSRVNAEGVGYVYHN
jgi:hypothetical protein